MLDTPSFLAKKEVFQWLKQGRKTIDVRKGNLQRGDVAVFISGPHRLTMKVVGTQSGRLTDVVREDNFRLVIPTAVTVDDAVAYLRRLYGGYDGVFTAYFVVA